MSERVNENEKIAKRISDRWKFGTTDSQEIKEKVIEALDAKDAALEVVKGELEKLRPYSYEIVKALVDHRDETIATLQKENEQLRSIKALVGDYDAVSAIAHRELTITDLQSKLAEAQADKEKIAFLEDRLMAIIKNDKTVYAYEGKDSLNRDGMYCSGQRFKTPREIAKEALAQIAEKGERNK